MAHDPTVAIRVCMEMPAELIVGLFGQDALDMLEEFMLVSGKSKDEGKLLFSLHYLGTLSLRELRKGDAKLADGRTFRFEDDLLMMYDPNVTGGVQSERFLKLGQELYVSDHLQDHMVQGELMISAVFVR